MHDTHHISTRTPALCHSRKRRPHPVLPLLLLTALGWAAAVSCTKDVPEQNSDEQAIGFASATETKLVNSIDDIKSFDVWGYNYDPAEADAPGLVFDGATVSLTAEGSWAYNDIRYWMEERKYDFYGVYPTGVSEASLDISTGDFSITDYDISTTDTDGIRQDLMFASSLNQTYDPSTNQNPKKVLLTFYHLLSRISLRVLNSTADNALGVSSVLYQATIQALPKIGTFSTFSDSWTLQPSTTYECPAIQDNSSLTPDAEGTLLFPDLLVFPQSLAGSQISLEVSYSLTGNENDKQTKTILLNTLSEEWIEGQHYRYTLDLSSSTDLTLNINVIPWNEDDYSLNFIWD